MGNTYSRIYLASGNVMFLPSGEGRLFRLPERSPGCLRGLDRVQAGAKNLAYGTGVKNPDKVTTAPLLIAIRP
jgi:hypothetical protein